MQINVRGSVDKVAKTGRPYKSLEVSDDKGEVFKVNIFSNFPDFANVKQGSVIMGNLKQDGQYWNIEPEGIQMNRAKPNFDRIIEKKQQGIAEAQTEKAKNIALAQDRSAWMWAKTNASTIITSPNLRDGETSSAEEMVDKMIKLATKIYNAEPTEPF